MHVYRWDLDKTYLDTDIHSMRGMLRTALETAVDKRTVPGADVLLRSLLAHDPQSRATVLSGSPTQMRAVLEEKLALDGIRIDQLVLKDNLRNLTRGRFRAVRGQVGYKLPQLLAHRLSEPPTTTESLFGDDSEADAAIYALYADAVAGRVDEATLVRVMRAGDAYDDQIDSALRSMARLHAAEAVTDIWIHTDRGLPLRTFELLGPRVRVVYSWTQAALGLWQAGRLGPGGVVAVWRRAATDADLVPARLAALVQDAVRRGLVDADRVVHLLESHTGLETVAAPVRRAIELLGPLPGAPQAPSTPDYEGFLEAANRWATGS